MEHVYALGRALDPTKIDRFEWSENLPLTAKAVPFTACAIYLVTIFVLFQIFKNRGPVRGKVITTLLVAHNLFLSIGSAVLLILILIELLADYKTYGGEPLMCDLNRIARHLKPGRVQYYFWLFYLSKIYEFIDTVFVIIKKHPLIFLHWWHHITTLLVVWYTVLFGCTINWICICTNLGVHVVMYFYYFLATIGKKPKWDLLVTIIQIVQFVFDLGIFGTGIYMHYSSGWKCSGDPAIWSFGAVILTTFLILFVRMFIRRYISPKNKENAAAGSHKKGGKQH